MGGGNPGTRVRGLSDGHPSSKPLRAADEQPVPFWAYRTCNHSRYEKLAGKRTALPDPSGNVASSSGLPAERIANCHVLSSVLIDAV
ncbi:hypothetical protein GGTG_03296 [Gaeumannomyces tritici R3-111a-1]|uniref:Uncharacterized protein n=1 Tax=Gaeumannomyces tritici (strain R3-111a-1) TaxID=644352 RepID=J3NPT9_GAET3|nr:hypothetical protein GGTG_03296 [Gaeumannomyces tritici R3-111a-1]EJT78194.1 hypothetical protein GGTG_03296 [Gaeumannomyces tritici R3-111a-1]